MESTLIIGLIIAALTVGLVVWFRKKPTKEYANKQVDEKNVQAILKQPLPEKSEKTVVIAHDQKLEEQIIGGPSASVAKRSWKERLTSGLSRSRQEVWGKLEHLFSKPQIDEAVLEELEEILYGADLGPKLVGEMLEELKELWKKGEFNSENSGDNKAVNKIKKYFYQKLFGQLETVQQKVSDELFQVSATSKKPTVIMIVGVNGVGKTTTIGKLATRLSRQGAKVMVGACDTFRAAAVDQLAVWCERANAEMVRANEGASPSGVGYEALQKAIADQADYCILDTAGRLHTKGNLMEELKKSRDVLKKLDPTAPHHVLLVLDAITGQNALRQAQEFNKTLGLTGIIFTKCDGSSKAGSAVGIVQELQVPITYIGVGEDVEDLDRFVLQDYLAGLLQFQGSMDQKAMS